MYKIKKTYIARECRPITKVFYPNKKRNVIPPREVNMWMSPMIGKKISSRVIFPIYPIYARAKKNYIFTQRDNFPKTPKSPRDQARIFKSFQLQLIWSHIQTKPFASSSPRHIGWPRWQRRAQHRGEIGNQYRRRNTQEMHPCGS